MCRTMQTHDGVRGVPLNGLAGLLVGLVGAAALDLTAPDVPDAATRAEARDILEGIVGIESSIGKGQVLKLADTLADRFRKGGFPAADVQVLPQGENGAIVVRYRGSGTGGRPIALLAHLDVVTAKRSDWQRDPFRLTEENGYFYGRGTLDDKSEVSLLCETFLRLKREGFVPTRDLIVEFSGDEETAEVSALDLLTRHRDMVDAEFALNSDYGGGVLDETTGKPFLFFVQGAEKTSVGFTLTTRNPGGHSSRPRSDNAIYELADALKALQRLKFPLMWNEWTLGDFKAESEARGGALGAAMARFAANPSEAAAAAVIAEQPAQIGKLGTTCVATMLQGGHAENALPQSATATVSCRVFPGMPIAEVLKTLKGVVGAKVDVRQLYEPVVSDPSPMRLDVMQAVALAVDAANPGARVVPTQVSYATDGAIYRVNGIPTYGLGATFIKESEDFAHGLNERVPVASFYHGLTYWYVLIKTLAGKP